MISTLYATVFTLDPLLLNQQTRAGNTALHIAAYHRRYDTVACLLAAGASPNIPNRSDLCVCDFDAQTYRQAAGYAWRCQQAPEAYAQTLKEILALYQDTSLFTRAARALLTQYEREADLTRDTGIYFEEVMQIGRREHLLRF